METGGNGGETISSKLIGRAILREGTDVGVEVVDTAGAEVEDLHLGVTLENGSTATGNAEGNLTDSHVDLGEGRSLLDIVALGVAIDSDLESSIVSEESDNEDLVGHGLDTVGATLEVVTGSVVGRNHGGISSIAVEILQRRAVPVNDTVLSDVRSDIGITSLVSSNVRDGHIQPSTVGKTVGPLGVTIVEVRGVETTDVVRLSVIVPGDDFEELGSKGEDLSPSVVPERVTREDPVLAEGDLRTEVGREPRRDRSKVGLSSKGIGVSLVTISNADIRSTIRSLVVAVVGPGHPVEGTVNGGEVALSGVEVGDEEEVASSGTESGDVESVTSEGGGEGLAVDLELGGVIGILGDLLANFGGLSGVVPVEVEGDEDVHAIVGGRLVSKCELGVGVGINTNVQGKGINTDAIYRDLLLV